MKGKLMILEQDTGKRQAGRWQASAVSCRDGLVISGVLPAAAPRLSDSGCVGCG
jgi:hypothetical protein